MKTKHFLIIFIALIIIIIFNISLVITDIGPKSALAEPPGLCSHCWKDSDCHYHCSGGYLSGIMDYDCPTMCPVPENPPCNIT